MSGSIDFNITRMGYVRGQPARVGFPNLDGAIPSPGSNAPAVGTKRHGPDRGFVAPEDTKLTSGARTFPPGRRNPVLESKTNTNPNRF